MQCLDVPLAVCRVQVYAPRYLFGIRAEVFHVNKILTVVFLAATALLFSRQYIPAWIGLTWASPATGSVRGL